MTKLNDLYTYLYENDPDLFACLLDNSIPHTEIADAVRERYGSDATTEASVRRARTKANEAPLFVPLEKEEELPSTKVFSNEDREQLHVKLDRMLDAANTNGERVTGLQVSQWDGLTKGEDGEPQVTTLRSIKMTEGGKDAPRWLTKTPTLDEISLRQNYQPLGETAPESRSGTLVVALGDLQVGKVNEQTDEIGSDDLILRVQKATHSIVRYINDTGRAPSRIVLLHAGDCIEGYNSQGGKLIKFQDLYLTQQVELYQRLLEFQIMELYRLCDDIVVSVVPGNHDEATRDFESSTKDSWALFAARNSAKFLQASGYKHLEWHFPEPGYLAVEFEAVPGFYMTMTHGHKIASGSNQIMDWWRRATFGRMPGHKSQILVTGHFHHLRCEVGGDGRNWIQVPAMDGGSAWFANRRGDSPPPGMVTFWLEAGNNYPVQDMRIHS